MAQDDSESTRTSAVLDLEGKTLTITLAAAGKMRQALEDYLLNSRKEIAQKVPPDLIEELDGSVGDPWIDNSGNVRMGTWLLEARKGAPTLTFRPLPPGNHQYVATLEQKGDAWKVVALGFNVITLRR